MKWRYDLKYLFLIYQHWNNNMLAFPGTHQTFTPPTRRPGRSFGIGFIRKNTLINNRYVVNDNLLNIRGVLKFTKHTHLILIPILQMSKLRLREIQRLIHAHVAGTSRLTPSPPHCEWEDFELLSQNRKWRYGAKQSLLAFFPKWNIDDFALGRIIQGKNRFTWFQFCRANFSKIK